MPGIDIKLIKDKNGLYDISFKNGDIETTNSFDTSIINSLFCDRRASSHEIKSSELRRGWWGNTLNNDISHEIGSKLWLLEQARVTQDTLNKAIDYARTSLQWLISDGYLNKINVTGSYERNKINLNTQLFRPNGIVDTQAYVLWENTGNI